MQKPRLLILPLLFLFSYSFTKAQTPISGIINTYHKVTAIVSAKSCVVVDNAGALGPGDRVMLVQMKGAGIKTTTSGFGDTASLNKAGNYELNSVCMVKGDSVFLVYTIVQQYTVADKVQLVYMPVYDNALVVDSLKAAPWDNSTGKGGVLALSVTYSLFLNAPVSATGAGFKGGVPKKSSDECVNLFFPASDPYYNAADTLPQNGAYKGESVWEPTNALYTGGRAAVANGGGGGNNHNNGGAGGANLSDGGNGGGNNSAAGCYVSNPGEGGHGLKNYGGTRIFLGGGGGAGHINNALLFEGGGSGGGIVYLQAQSLQSSGRTISANGSRGGNARGDGASGGGAGGTIVMNVALYSDAVNIEAKGGNGGEENDDLNDKRCYGEGGGGSGGGVYFKAAGPAGSVSVSGGAKGLKYNSLNCNTPVPGTPGAIGKTFASYTPVQSTTLSTSCSFVLPTTLLYFKAVVTNNDVTLRWQVVQPGDVRTFVVERKKGSEGWKETAQVAAREGVDTYSVPDQDLPGGDYTYRLKILEKGGPVIYSPLRRVVLAARDQLTVYPNPTQGVLHILLPPGADKELRVYDLSGRLVIRQPVAGGRGLLSEDVSVLQKGIYILRIGMLYKVFTIQ